MSNDPSADTPAFSHLDEKGEARMVGVGAKPVIPRFARAEGFVRMKSATVAQIRDAALPKGDILAVARIAGIMAAKRTAEWIPLCHTLPLTRASVEFQVEEEGVRIFGEAETIARTGVEMEALTAVSAAALTLYDMAKAVDKEMVIEDIRLVEKRKG